MDFELLFSAPAIISLLTLAALEIVLGIDNIIIITVMSSRLPAKQRELTFRLGLAGAGLTRIGLLFAITWVMKLKADLFTLPIMNQGISGKDLILIGGGLFLMAKATHEIYEKLEAPDDRHGHRGKAGATMWFIVLQVMIIDIVFSLDSVITAVGLVEGTMTTGGVEHPNEELAIMVTAILVAVAVMMFFAASVGRFVNRNPTIKILALSFLILIGVLLMAEGFGQHISKGYIYFAMAFSLGVEFINMKVRGKDEPVKLHDSYDPDAPLPAPAEEGAS